MKSVVVCALNCTIFGHKYYTKIFISQRIKWTNLYSMLFCFIASCDPIWCTLRWVNWHLKCDHLSAFIQKREIQSWEYRNICFVFTFFMPGDQILSCPQRVCFQFSLWLWYHKKYVLTDHICMQQYSPLSGRHDSSACWVFICFPTPPNLNMDYWMWNIHMYTHTHTNAHSVSCRERREL